jgi:hypothetical protein
MKPTTALWISLLSASLTGVGHTAGGPMNQDLTPLTATAQRAADAGKRGDATVFVKEAEDALAQAKTQADSAAQQRIVKKLKLAVSEGKASKLPEATQAVEDAMTDMKASGPPRFGGGT